jgi:hypothetical protein
LLSSKCDRHRLHPGDAVQAEINQAGYAFESDAAQLGRERMLALFDGREDPRQRGRRNGPCMFGETPLVVGSDCRTHDGDHQAVGVVDDRRAAEAARQLPTVDFQDALSRDRAPRVAGDRSLGGRTVVGTMFRVAVRDDLSSSVEHGIELERKRAQPAGKIIDLQDG